jgi:voltage-gated potassium channel Kch
MLFIKTIIAFLKDKDYREILISTSVVITIGTVFYHFQEGWGWLDSLYFSVITLTTIGYGDFSPATDLGKIFTIFYIVIGLGMILSFIHIIYNHFNEISITGGKRDIKEEENMNK